MTDVAIPARASSWQRLDARFAPWLTDAFAAGAGLVAFSGLVSLGIAAGLGDGFESSFDGTWAFVLSAFGVAAAFLAETRAPRPMSAACTAVVAVGIPVAVFLLFWAPDSYGDVRAIEVISMLAWLAVFAVGGTRGRAIFLGLALVVAWAFVVGEAADLARATRDQVPIDLSNFGFATSPGGSGDITFDDQGNPVFDVSGPGSQPARGMPDRTVAIGITSGIAGALFLFGLRRSDIRGRQALGAAFVIPAVLAVATAVIAFSARVDKVWFGALASMVAGVAVGWAANGRRRFLTWIGAAGAILGVVLLTGDFTDRVTGDGATSDGARNYGVLALVMGAAALAAVYPLAALVREPLARPRWLASRRPPPTEAGDSGDSSPDGPPATPGAATVA